MKSVVKKGKAPVDDHCHKASSAHVFCDGDDGVVWDCMLNQGPIVYKNRSRFSVREKVFGKSYSLDNSL